MQSEDLKNNVTVAGDSGGYCGRGGIGCGHHGKCLRLQEWWGNVCDDADKQHEQATHSQYRTLNTCQAPIMSGDTRTRFAEASTGEENRKEYQAQELNERWRRHL